jgi:serine/threonine protein kinase
LHAEHPTAKKPLLRKRQSTNCVFSRFAFRAFDKPYEAAQMTRPSEMDLVLLNPNGIDENEVAGIDAFRRELPATWLGYANLELRDPSDPLRRQREIDVVLVTHDRVLIVDLKNWHGKLANHEGQWVLNGRLKTQSAELKLGKNAKKVASLLRTELRVPSIPVVEHFVVFIPPDIDFSALPPGERVRCLTLESFIACLTDPTKYRSRFPKDSYWNEKRPFFGQKVNLNRIFRIGKHFEPQKLWFADVYPLDSEAIFRHPKRVYDEFLVQRHDNPEDLALLRLWDFSRLPARAAAVSYRRELAGRELDVLTRIRNQDYRLYEEGVLKSERRDEDVGIRYWELFRRNRTMSPWSEFLTKTKLTREERLRFSRLLISRVADLHRLGIAHTDVGDHAVWIDQYENRVMLTAFGAAHYPNTGTVRDLRDHLAASEIIVPEASESGLLDAPFRRDVFLVAALAWQIITGRAIETADGVPVLLERDVTDNALIPAELRAWFLKALAFAPEDRFASLESAQRDYNKASETTIGDPSARRLNAYRVDSEPHFKYPTRNPEDVLRQGFSQIWKHTNQEGSQVVIKFWPHRGETLEANGPAILALFARIEAIRIKRPKWASPVREFGLSDTGVFIVQDFVDAPSIAEYMPDGSAKVIETAANLVTAIDELHAMGFVHGDLKPDHVRIRQTAGHFQPIFLDLFELTAPTELATNTAYYPPIDRPDGATIDRYAISRLVSELCERLVELDPTAIAPLALAADECAHADIQWRSLAPLDAFLARHRKQQEKRRTITITLALPKLKARLLEAHCGVFLIIVRGERVHLVGAQEQLSVAVEATGWSVRLAPTPPAFLEIASRTPYRFKGDILVKGGAPMISRSCGTSLRHLNYCRSSRAKYVIVTLR